PARRLSTAERVLAVLPVESDTLRVVATVLRGFPRGHWPDSTVEAIRIVDRRGAVQFSDSLFPYRDSTGALAEQYDVAAWPISWDAGRGLLLGRWDEPSAPGTG